MTTPTADELPLTEEQREIVDRRLEEHRLNPQRGEIENPEVLFFTTRLLRQEFLEIPVEADLRLVTPSRG